MSEAWPSVRVCIVAQPYRDAETFITALAGMAEELRRAILAMPSEAERSDHVMKLVAESEMVFGIWPDPETADGIGILIIKGDDIMPPLVGFKTSVEVHLAAIPCARRELAVEARREWG